MVVYLYSRSLCPPSSCPAAKCGNDDDDAASEGSLDIGACCLCHCALDYSDRAAFFREDREEDYHEDSDEEEYFFRPSDPYLPVELYNPNNALVYCDSCNRMYHQHCHFVPVLVVPRGRWHCLACQTKATASMFQSPPQLSAHKKEQAWEVAQGNRKAMATKTECRKLTQFCQSQLSNLRLASTALETLTSTAKNMAHFSNHSSQELVQTVFKMTSAKYKLRQSVRSLEDWRSGNLALDGIQRLKQFVLPQSTESGLKKARPASSEFVTRVLFPFGADHPIRAVPRTDEAGHSASNDQSTASSAPGVPDEVVITGDAKPNRSKPVNNDKGDDGDDDGVSVDNLTCAVCWQATASDANDLVLCDGRGCYRSYHMRCVYPHLSESDLQLDDWFCPVCMTVADVLHLIQSDHHGDEWELQRHARLAKNQPCDGTLKSWESAQDVFPESEWEYLTALKLKEGTRDADTKKLLARALGLDEESEGRSKGSEDEMDEDSEDEHFDPDTFEMARQAEGVEDSDDDATRSSQATMADMSSVELEIGKDELAALSDHGEDSDEQESVDDPSTRRSRRLSKRVESTTTTSDEVSSDDPGKLDESNILAGKRKRTTVDYRRLNDALFGSIVDVDNDSLDDLEDFRPTAASSKRSSTGDDDSDGCSASCAERSSTSKGGGVPKRSVTTAKSLPRNVKGRKSSTSGSTTPTKESASLARNGETETRSRSKGKSSRISDQSANSAKHQSKSAPNIANGRISKTKKGRASAFSSQESSRQKDGAVSTRATRKRRSST